jgi:hypothetical protein
MARHTTARGEPIDIGALIAQNATTKALGNARMNARGDVLNENGIVLKTQEQVEAEWAADKAKQKLLSGRPSNIKAPIETMIDPSKAPQQKILTEDQDFEPEATVNSGRPDVSPPVAVDPAKVLQKAPRRKITETD